MRAVATCFVLVGVLLTGCGGSGSVADGTVRWTALAGDGRWDTAGNWSVGRVPTESDVAVFDLVAGGADCLVEGTVLVGGLQILSPFASRLTVAGTLEVAGDALLAAPEAVDVEGLLDVGGELSLPSEGSTLSVTAPAGSVSLVDRLVLRGDVTAAAGAGIFLGSHAVARFAGAAPQVVDAELDSREGAWSVVKSGSTIRFVREIGATIPGSSVQVSPSGDCQVTFEGGLDSLSFGATSNDHAVEIVFGAGTWADVKDATLMGTSGHRLVLRSSVPGEAWGMWLLISTSSYDWLTVTDCQLTVQVGGTITATNSIDGGGNVNWLFE